MLIDTTLNVHHVNKQDRYQLKKHGSHLIQLFPNLNSKAECERQGCRNAWLSLQHSFVLRFFCLGLPYRIQIVIVLCVHCLSRTSIYAKFEHATTACWDHLALLHIIFSVTTVLDPYCSCLCHICHRDYNMFHLYIFCLSFTAIETGSGCD